MISVHNESLICDCDGAEILRPWLFVVVCEHTSIHDDILSRNRVTDKWNNLPQCCINCTTLNNLNLIFVKYRDRKLSKKL